MANLVEQKCGECAATAEFLTYSKETAWTFACRNDEHINGTCVYNVDLADFATANGVIDWICHMEGKQWFPETRDSWIYALGKLIGHH